MDIKPQYTLTMQHSLRQKMAACGYKDFYIEHVSKLLGELSQNGVQADKFIGRLMRSVSDNGEFQDILTEGGFALILVQNGFLNVHLEPQPEGPDIEACFNGSNVYFEVTRRRPNEEDEAVEIASEKGTAHWVNSDTQVSVSPRGDIQARIIAKSLIQKIECKLRQAKLGGIYIVVLWSDSVRTDLLDSKVLFRYFEKEIADNPDSYDELSGILFTTGGIDLSTGAQFYLYKNDYALCPIPPPLEEKLRGLKAPI